MRFDSVARTIVWATTGQASQDGVWEVNGDSLLPSGVSQVRFGTSDGERAAFLTETGPATIRDIEASNNEVFISSTNVPVQPQTE